MTARIYISGPMSGLPEYNRPAFYRAAAELRFQGHEVVNPAEMTMPDCTPWPLLMRACLRDLVDCDAIHMLPGWYRSRGAQLEHAIAIALGMTITGAHS